MGCPPAAVIENAAQLNAIMLRAVKAGGLTGILEDSRINALCIGPGLGVSDESGSLLATALKSGRSVVVDADALTLIARAVAFELGAPKIEAALGHACQFALRIGMLVPHAAMDKDYDLAGREHQIKAGASDLLV